MRKINTILVLLAILILIVKVAISGLYMLGIIQYQILNDILGGAISFILALHIIISLGLMIKNARKKPPIKFYVNLHKVVFFQNLTGILLIIFTPLHVVFNVLQGFPAKPTVGVFSIIHGIIDIVFATLICLHLYIGMPRLLVTCGFINSSKTYTKAEKVTSIVLVLIWVFLVAGLIKLFFIPML